MRTHRRLSATFLVAAALLPTAAIPASARQVDAVIRLDPSHPAGTDSAGRVLLYAPDPLEPGSSISHWDPSATPSLLMEPANSPDLAVGQVDLTLPALEDMGWRTGQAKLTLRYGDPAGQGFNDPQLGNQRRAAIERVAQIWGGLLKSGVEINVGVTFKALPCDQNNGATLAQAGTQYIFSDFPGAPLANTWFVGAEAEALSGQNLSLQDAPNDPNAPDIAAEFNSALDKGCLGPGTRFYYGLDGKIPQGQISFLEVALHEIGHGLGFASLADNSSGQFIQGIPDIYSRFIFDADRNRTWDRMSVADRKASAINSGRVAWDGVRVTGAAKGFLTPAPSVAVASPLAAAGTYPAAAAQFGPAVTLAGLSGSLAVADDGSAQPTLACNALRNGAAVRGKIVLVDRGDCFFVDKVKNAQNAGAVAVVIVNNRAGLPTPLGGTDASIRIPAVHVGQQDGALLKQAVLIGLPPLSPTGLTATTGAAGIDLHWTDASDDETGFHIERRPAGGKYQEIAAVGPGTETYADAAVQPNGTYSYRVRSQNEVGLSPFSNEAQATAPELAPPAAPGNLRATSVSAGSIRLDWDDRSGNEDAFVLERRAIAHRGPDGALTHLAATFEEGGDIPAGQTSLVVDGLEPATTYGFRLRARNASGLSGSSNEAAATTREAVPPSPCTVAAGALCLQGGRFEVRTFFRNQHLAGTPAGDGVPIPPLAGTTESGFFWFFDPTNIELVVKVLDATSFSGSYWVFYGALSDVEYWIVITDTTTGTVKTYYNPPGNICGGAEIGAFPSGTANLAAAPPARLAALPVEPLRPTISPATEGGCTPDAETLCLLDGRFSVHVTWENARDGSSGVGHAIPDPRGTTATGFFWFFSPSNVELIVKVLDGRQLNNAFWVFYGALSDVGYRIEVVDTTSQATSSYVNTQGNICGQANLKAFPQ